MNKKISMTAFKQYATTAYKGDDFSVLDVHTISEPQVQPLNASDFTVLWSKLFAPRNNSIPADIAMINALTFSLTWSLWLYDDVFPDDTNTPLTHLQNSLAILLQFMVTCAQFANSSVLASTSGLFGLPDDMQTAATSGKSTQPLMGQTWAVWTFIASAGLITVAVGGMFLWILLQQESLLNSPGRS
jgi:hypothetical protein